MSLEKIFALILIPIALIGFFVFLTISGPKKIDYSSQNPTVIHWKFLKK